MKHENPSVDAPVQKDVRSVDMVEEALTEHKRIKGQIKGNQSVVLFCSVGNWVIDVYAIGRSGKDFISVLGKNSAGEDCKILTHTADASFQIKILHKKPAPREIGFAAEMQYQQAQII